MSRYRPFRIPTLEEELQETFQVLNCIAEHHQRRRNFRAHVAEDFPSGLPAGHTPHRKQYIERCRELVTTHHRLLQNIRTVGLALERSRDCIKTLRDELEEKEVELELNDAYARRWLGLE